jgi:predicted PurR-regulated permease PerM
VSTEAIPWLQLKLNLPGSGLPVPEMRQKLAENWQSVGKLLATLGRYITGSGINFLVSLGNMVLKPVVGFYLLRDWDDLMARLLHMLPRAWHETVESLAGECDSVIGAFLRGQFLVMLALGVIYAVGLSIVGLELALLIGLVAGIASVVPYLGTFVGVVAGLAAALVQFQDWKAMAWVALVFAVGQVVEGYILTPNLVGDRIGLHPVAVIFAILAGGQLAGFIGVLIALPMAAVVLVFLRHIDEYYKDSALYNTGGRDDGD